MKDWNANVLIATGAVLGAALATAIITIWQTPTTLLDLQGLGEIAAILVAPLISGGVLKDELTEIAIEVDVLAAMARMVRDEKTAELKSTPCESHG